MPNQMQYLESLFNPNTGLSFDGRVEDIEVIIDTFKDDVPDNTFVKKIDDTTMTGVAASNNYSNTNNDLNIRENGVTKSNKIKTGSADKTFASGTNISTYDTTADPKLNLVGGYVSSSDIKDPSLTFVKEDSSGNVDFDNNEGSFRLKLKDADGLTDGLWFEENFGSSGIYSYAEMNGLVMHWNKADYSNTNRFNLTRLNHQHHVYDPSGNNNYYISVRPRNDLTGPFNQTFPNLSGEYILDQTPEYLGLNTARNSLNSITNGEIVLKTNTDTFSSTANNSSDWNSNTSWRSDFNSQNTGELLTRDGTNSFGTEVFGNNFSNIEIKKSSFGGILNSHIFAIDRQGSYTFQDFNQSGGQYNNSVIESSINSGTTMTIELPTASGQLATLNDIPTHYWAANGNDIYNTNSGNVGIGTGTTAPTEKLTLNNGNLLLTGTWVAGSAFKMMGINDAKKLEFNYSDGTIIADNNNIIFKTNYTSNVHTERMRINSSGDVGIGTTTPNELLEVSGDVPRIRLYDGTSSRNPGLEFVRGSSTFGSDGFHDYRIHDEGGNLKFYAQGTSGFTGNVLWLSYLGRVGVKKDSPSGVLDIGGTNRTTHIHYQADSSEDTYLRGGKSASNVYINDRGSGITGKVGILTNSINASFDCEIAGTTLVSNNFKSTGEGLFAQDNEFKIQTDASNGVKLTFESNGGTTDFMQMGAYASVNNIDNFNRDLVIRGGSGASTEVARFESNYVNLQNATHSKLNFTNTTTAGSYNYMSFYDSSSRIYYVGQDGGNNGDFMIGTQSSGRSLLVDRNTGKFKIQKNTEILANLSFDAGVNAQTYITIGGNSLASNLYGINLVSTASERKHVALGQDSTHSGFISWEYNSNVNDALFSFSTYGGANPLYLQRDGGNIGIGHFQDGVNSGKATRTLDVNGTFLSRSTATFQGLSNFENTITLQNGSPYLILRDTTDNDDIQIRFDGLTGGVNQTNARIDTANNYLNIGSTTTNSFNGLRFKTNSLLAATIDNNQYFYINNRLGLGGVTPTVTLDVDGDVKFNNGTFNNYNPQINHNNTTFNIDYYDLANPSAHPERFFKITQEGADSVYHDLFSYNNTTKEFLTIGNLEDNTTNPANSWANSRNWKTYDNTGKSLFGITQPYGFTIESIVQANRQDDVSKQDQETLTFAMKGHHSNEPISSYPDRLVSGQVAERISLDGTSSAKSLLNPEYTSQTLDTNVVGRSSLILSGKELNGRYSAEEIKNNVFTPKQITDLTPVTRNTENMGQMTFIGTNTFVDGANLYGRIVIQKDFIAPEDYNNSYNTTEPNTATQKQVYTWTGYFSTRTSYITPMLFKRKFAESRDGYSEDTWNCLLIGIGTTRQGSGSVGWQTFDFGLQLGTDVITEDCCLGYFCGSMIWDNLTKRFSVRTYDNNPLYYRFLDNLPNSSMWTPDSWTGLYSGTTSGIVSQPVFSTTERRIRQNGEGSLNTYFFTDNFYNKVGWKADYVPLSTDAFGSLTQRQYFFYFTARQKQAEYHQPSNKVISESLSKGRYENIGFNSPLLDAPNNSNYQLTQLKAPQFTNGSSQKYQAVSAVSFIGDDNFIISFWLNLSTTADTNTIVGQQTQIVLGSGGRNYNTGFQINIVAISGSSYSMQLFTANGSGLMGTIPIKIPSPVGGVWRHFEFVIKRQATNPYGGFSVPSQVGFNNFNASALSRAYINGNLVGHGCVLNNHTFLNTEFGIGGDSGTGTYNNGLSGYITKVFYSHGMSDSEIDIYTQQNSFNAGFGPEAGVNGVKYWYNKVLNESYPFYRQNFSFLWDFRGITTGAVAGAFPRGSIANYTAYANLQAFGSPTLFYVNGLNIYAGVDGEYQIIRRTDDGNETELFKEYAYTNYNDKAIRVSKDYVDINNGSVADIIHDNNNQPIGNYVGVNNLCFTGIQEYLRQPLCMEPIWVNETHPQIPCTTQRLVMFRKNYYVKGYSQQPLNARWLGRGKVLFEIRSNIYAISTPVINVRLMGWMLGPDCKYSGGTNFWSWVELANIPNQDRRIAFNGSNIRSHYNRWYYCDLDVIGRNYMQYVKLEITTIAGSWNVDQYDGFSCVMYSLPSITNLSGGIPSN